MITGYKSAYNGTKAILAMYNLERSQFPQQDTKELTTDLNDCLSEEVVRLPGELLPEPGLEVVILVPDPHLDPVARVVALAAKVYKKALDYICYPQFSL